MTRWCDRYTDNLNRFDSIQRQINIIFKFRYSLFFFCNHRLRTILSYKESFSNVQSHVYSNKFIHELCFRTQTLTF